MPNTTKKIIGQLVNEIKGLLGHRVKKIILYGSYARGDYDKNSDIDIMVLTDLTNDEIVKYRTQIWEHIYDIELENNIILSPLIKNIDEFNYWIDALPFYQNIQKEGVVLHG